MTSVLKAAFDLLLLKEEFRINAFLVIANIEIDENRSVSRMHPSITQFIAQTHYAWICERWRSFALDFYVFAHFVDNIFNLTLCGKSKISRYFRPGVTALARLTVFILVRIYWF